MADVQPLYVAADGLPTEMADDDSLDLGALTMSGDIAMGGNEVTGLPATPSATGAVSKEYADALINSLPPKGSCRLATAATLTGWTASGSGVGKTLTAPDNATSRNDFDGVTSAVSDRILVKDGPADTDNGIYTVTQLGDGATQPCILTRATDMDQDAEIQAGDRTWIAEGNTLADTYWAITTNDPIDIEDANTWTQFGGPGSITGGDGIDITGSVASVDLATGAVLDPGLQFGTGADAGKLAVLPDGTKGVQVGSGGVEVKVDGSTITFDGSGQLQAAAATIAEDLKEEVTANEAVSAGDPVFWGGADDEVRESQAATAGRKKVVGIMEDGVTGAGTGTMVRRGTAVGVLSGATVGDRYFLAAAGGLTTTPPTGSGDAVIFVGHARSATDLDVQIQFISRRP